MRQIGIIGHPGSLLTALVLSQMTRKGYDIVKVIDIEDAEEFERGLDIYKNSVPSFPIIKHPGLTPLYVDPIERTLTNGSTMNQRKRRKFARQNPHSKYNRK